MNPAIIIGIVILFGGVIGVMLYLGAQKRKEAERKRQEEAERRRQEEAARKAKEEAEEAAKEAKEKAEQKIKAMKAESDAKIARLASEAKKDRENAMLRAKLDEQKRATENAQRQAGNAERARAAAQRARAAAQRARGVAKKEAAVGRHEGPRNPAVFMATVAMVLGISGAAVKKLSDRAKMGDRGAQMRLRKAGRKAKSIIRSDPRGAHRRAKQHAKRMMIHRRRGRQVSRKVASVAGRMHRGRHMKRAGKIGKTRRGGMRRGRFGRTGRFSKKRARKIGKTRRGGMRVASMFGIPGAAVAASKGRHVKRAKKIRRRRRF